MDNEDMKREIVGKIYQVTEQGSEPSLQYDQEKRLVLLEQQLKELLVAVNKSSAMAGLSRQT